MTYTPTYQSRCTFPMVVDLWTGEIFLHGPLRNGPWRNSGSQGRICLEGAAWCDAPPSYWAKQCCTQSPRRPGAHQLPSYPRPGSTFSSWSSRRGTPVRSCAGNRVAKRWRRLPDGRSGHGRAHAKRFGYPKELPPAHLSPLRHVSDFQHRQSVRGHRSGVSVRVGILHHFNRRKNLVAD